MLCGNDPRGRDRLTALDRRFIEWFRLWLEWCSLPEDERGPEPASPSGDQPMTERRDQPDDRR